MRFLVEISDQEVFDCFPQQEAPDQAAREEILDAIDAMTGFLEIKVTVLADGGAA